MDELTITLPNGARLEFAAVNTPATITADAGLEPYGEPHPMPQPQQMGIVKNRAMLPPNGDWLAEWEIVALRVGESTGLRRFEPHDGPYTRPLPLPVFDRHDGPVVGGVAEVEQVGADLVFRGWFNFENGWQMLDFLRRGEITGCSVDLDEDTHTVVEPSENAWGRFESYTRWRVAGVSFVPIPALPSAGIVRFALNPEIGAHEPGTAAETIPNGARTPGGSGGMMSLSASGVALEDREWDEIVARIDSHYQAGGGLDRDTIRSLFTATAPKLDAPAEWFTNPELDRLTAPTVDEHGRFFGHLAGWGQCHIAISNQCVTAPRSKTGYRHFNRVPLDLADGSTVMVGKITSGCGHAGRTLSADRTVAHYDDSGWTAAFVTVGEDDHGIWFSGALNPFAAQEQLFAVTTSQFSGDWRQLDGNLELVAGLAVNVPGFPIAARTAFNVTDDGRVTSMICVTASAAECPACDLYEEQSGIEVRPAWLDANLAALAGQFDIPDSETLQAAAEMERRRQLATLAVRVAAPTLEQLAAKIGA